MHKNQTGFGFDIDLVFMVLSQKPKPSQFLTVSVFLGDEKISIYS
jgi:hypothetical protein